LNPNFDWAIIGNVVPKSRMNKKINIDFLQRKELAGCIFEKLGLE
jgi:hypothetical protein